MIVQPQSRSPRTTKQNLEPVQPLSHGKRVGCPEVVALIDCRTIAAAGLHGQVLQQVVAELARRQDRHVGSRQALSDGCR